MTADPNRVDMDARHQPTPPNPTLALLEEARRYACECALDSAHEPAGGEVGA